MCLSKCDELVWKVEQIFDWDGFYVIGMDVFVVEIGIFKIIMFKYFCNKEELILVILCFKDEILCNWMYWWLESVVEML